MPAKRNPFVIENARRQQGSGVPKELIQNCKTFLRENRLRVVVLRAQLVQQKLKPERQLRFLWSHMGSQPLTDRFGDRLAGLRINPVGAFSDWSGIPGSVSA